jgi:hypothetical protein
VIPLPALVIEHTPIRIYNKPYPNIAFQKNRAGTISLPFKQPGVFFFEWRVQMTSYIVVSIISGILFGALDGLINANPMAVKLFEVYKPISRTSINVAAGVVIDLVYGFVMAGIFLLIYKSLPGETGLVKGLCYGLIVWFFRVAMSVISQWMMYQVPLNTLFYSLVTGLGEMLILGILFGLALHPAQ